MASNLQEYLRGRHHQDDILRTVGLKDEAVALAPGQDLKCGLYQRLLFFDDDPAGQVFVHGGLGAVELEDIGWIGLQYPDDTARQDAHGQ